ncbi:DUF4230 domain-containing protein [Clostridium sp. YIM B02505]|uniref:DUF4230 domain-containing protein n=1 Tax=Clostridium yunnanense TaxID=2800325 RepID=A0ABS1EW05_9CLOT|nr:DUF4230 domain-containing protein [Clostridium yunnanense]MBK1813520.1 DUF4230 domain-containing protein [Clostridium yunnanense]
MFKKLRKKTFNIVLAFLVFTSFGCYISYRIIKDKETAKITKILPSNSNTKLSFITEESIVDKIQKVSKLVVVEVDLNEKMIIDNSWGDWDVFKKLQKVDYYGKGSYSIDLSSLDSSKVKIDKLNKKITISLPKPAANTPTIDYDKTTFESTEKGLLRFGDIKLTKDESAVIDKEVISRMDNKLKETALYDEAVKNGEDTIQDLIKPIVDANVKISIIFE